MNAINLRKMMFAIALVVVLAGYAQADMMQFQENLSKNVSIKLKDVTIAEALDKIGQKAEVKIVLSDEAAWRLPQGQATRLSVALDGPLAESMPEMLNAFFMRYAVGDEEVTIYPRTELEHILGRPTTKQLELLKKIYQGNIKIGGHVDSRTIINEMFGQEVVILPVDRYRALSHCMNELGRELPEGEHSPRFTLAQMLDSVGGEWYLSGMDFLSQIIEIWIVTPGEFRQAKLNQKVDISYKDGTLGKIYQDLASRAGTPLIVEPGCYLHEWPLSVSMQNISIYQAFLSIADMVGAYIQIADDGIRVDMPAGGYVRGPEAPTPGTTTGKSDDGAYVGKISIPMDDGRYFLEFMLREKDLTEELQKIRAETMKKILSDLPKPPETSKK